MSEQDFMKTVRALMDDKRWEDAIVALGPKLEEEPICDELLWSVGWAHFKLEQYAKASSYLRRAADLGPTKSSNAACLAFALFELADYEGAELWFLKALALRDTSLARGGLALVYMKQDKAALAEAVHEEGIRLKPASQERVEAYADFLSDVGREEEAQRLYESASMKKAEGD
jgi:Flp pilus assembly protein TadD